MADIKTKVVVIGSGPGGYTAAFRAADLGLDVTLIERFSNIGGVCLNVGCIPSKALLHAAKVIDEAHALSQHGIDFGQPKIDIKALCSWKDGIVKRLTGGLKALAKQRKVKIVQGYAKFTSPHELAITHEDKIQTLQFEQAIIAVGSRIVKLPFLPDDPRILDSTSALTLPEIPKHMLVIGGGIIGLEMATVYRQLGSKISVVELTDSLMPGVDKDIVGPYYKRVKSAYDAIMLKTKVTAVKADKKGLTVTFEGENAPAQPVTYDYILSAVGRAPNGQLIDVDKAGVNVDERGFISVDKQQRTHVEHIYAIGDVVGEPMLAHKAIPEGRVAAEVIAGKKHYFDPRCIPAVAYTDPEVAWVGLTEIQAKAQNIAYETGSFPWAASGRSLSMGRNEGMTKVIFEKDTHRIIGCGIVGPHAGDLIAEAALAIEMGCDAEDIALTIHPHPTLSETIAMATEVFEGTVTDLYMPKK